MVAAVCLVGLLPGCSKEKFDVQARSEIPAPPTPEAVLKSIEQSSLRPWSFDDHEALAVIYRGKDLLPAETCPEAEQLEKTPVEDEFQRRDQKTKLESAKRACFEKLRQSAPKLPAFSYLDVNVERVGEFNFEKAKFDLHLAPTTTPPDANELRRYFRSQLKPGSIISNEKIENLLIVNVLSVGSQVDLQLEGADSPLLRREGETAMSIDLPVKEEEGRKLKSRLVDAKNHLRVRFLFRPYGAGKHVASGIPARLIAFRVVDDLGTLTEWQPFAPNPALDSLPFEPKNG